MSRTSALVLILSLTTAASAQVTPEESAAKMKPAEGLEATLWASEPMVVNPTTMDIDSRGRVWITEGLNYRLTRGGNKQFKRIEDADKIKIIEDTDGDGKADRLTVFADNVFPVPMGIAVEEHWSKDGKYKGCKVFVGNSPDLLVLEDTDGDDKADKRYPLLTGFGGIDSDHGVHGMTLGPDGKLYFTHGDGCCSVQQDKSERQQNFDVVDKSGRHVSSDQLANTLRVNRDGTQFEIIADRQRNNYETCLNSFGNIFTSDNDDDGNRGSRVIWVMEGGKYGYRTPGSPRHWGEEVPGNVPKLVGTGNGSPCGVMVYEGALLPKEYLGAILEAEAGPRVINFFPITRKGAAFRTDHKIMLASDDPWFRPVDVTAAPDGSVFVADWYDGGVGGHAFKDQTTGRIYRVAPKGAKSKSVKVDFGTTEGLIAALKSPVVAARDVARRLLIERGAESQNAIAGMFLEGTPIEKARALWVWHGIDGDTAVMFALTPLAKAPVEVVEQAARILGRDVSRVGKVEGTPPQAPAAAKNLEVLSALADHPDAGVRRELILALRDLPTDRVGSSSVDGVGDMLKKLAASWDGRDRWYLEALGLALRNREPEFLAKLFDGKLYGDLKLEADGKTDGVALPPYFPVDRNEAYLSTADELPPANALTKTLGLMWMVHRKEVLPLLIKVMPGLETPELQKAADDVMGLIDDPAAAIVIADQVRATKDPARARPMLAMLARKLDGAWKPAASAEQIISIIRLASDRPELRVEGIRMAAATGDPRHADMLIGMIQNAKLPEDARAAAVEAMVRVGAPTSRALLSKLIDRASETKSSDLAAEAAVRSLPRLGDARDQLSTLMMSDSAPLGLRREALRTFVGLGDGAGRVLKMVRDKSLPDALRTETATLLRTNPDRRVRDEVAELMPFKTASGKPLPPIGDLIRRDGDAVKGREVFFRASAGANACGSCHRVQGQGQWIGPDLSTIGTKYGRDELLRSVLNPNAAIGYNFRSQVVATADGQTLTGLLVEETPERIVLKTAEGKRVEVKRSEVEERQTSEISLMPEGLAEALHEQELVDVLAFLTTLKQPVSIVGQFQAAGPVLNSGTVTKPEEITADAPLKSSRGDHPWRRLVADAEGRITLEGLADSRQTPILYLATPVSSAIEQRARLVLDTELNVEAWLNGRPLKLPAKSDDGPRAVEIMLPKGTSRLLLTAANAGRPDADTALVATFVADRPVEFSPATAESASR